MKGGNRIFELIRRAAIPALALLIVGTFAGHAIAGPNGLLAWGGYHRALKERQAELTQLEARRCSCGIIRLCSTRRRPTPTWPTNWYDGTWGWSAPTK